MNGVAGPRAVIFDLDGTLVDSAPDIVASVTHALSTIGVPVPDRDRITRFVGNGAARLIHRVLTGDADGVADPALFDAASSLFFEHYAANVCVASTLYPGVRETLCALREDRLVLACVTNKPARFTLPLLAALGLNSFFSITLSGDSLPRKKPAPDPLLHVAAYAGLAPGACRMVGDSVTDIRAAHGAGMPAIAVSYGYGDTDDMAEHEPVAIVDAFADILHHLRRPLVATVD